jgi:hypothetical protein
VLHFSMAMGLGGRRPSITIRHASKQTERVAKLLDGALPSSGSLALSLGSAAMLIMCTLCAAVNGEKPAFTCAGYRALARAPAPERGTTNANVHSQPYTRGAEWVWWRVAS